MLQSFVWVYRRKKITFPLRPMKEIFLNTLHKVLSFSKSSQTSFLMSCAIQLNFVTSKKTRSAPKVSPVNSKCTQRAY